MFQKCQLFWFTVCQTSAPAADATRRRAFALVSQAYTSIVADDFAAFVGLPVEEAVKGILGLLCALQGKWEREGKAQVRSPSLKPLEQDTLALTLGGVCS